MTRVELLCLKGWRVKGEVVRAGELKDTIQTAWPNTLMLSDKNLFFVN